jgi:hypothetical protein
MSQAAEESNNVEGVELNGTTIDLEQEDDTQDARAPGSRPRLSVPAESALTRWV